MNLRLWWQAARPPTLWAAVSPVVIGVGCAAAAGCWRPMPALLALLGAVWIQIGTNFANDLFDARRGADGEDRLGPTRAVAAGLSTPRQMAAATTLAFAAATLCGLALTAYGGWPVVAIGVVSLLCGLAYTAGPWPLAYVGLGEVFVWIFFGWVAVAGTVWVQCLSLPDSVWWAGAVSGALCSAILVVNNLRDREGDARVGKRTLAVRFGDRFARLEYQAHLLIAALLLVAWFVVCGEGWLLLPFLAAPMAWRASRGVARGEGRALNPLLGATARLQLVVSFLLALGLTLMAS